LAENHNWNDLHYYRLSSNAEAIKMKEYHTTAAHFELFKKECRKWIDFFELNDWEIYFQHTKSDGKFSGIEWNSDDLIATIILSKDWTPGKNNIVTAAALKDSALHEVVHLLFGRIEGLALDRFLTKKELEKESEAMVHKLKKIFEKLEVK